MAISSSLKEFEATIPDVLFLTIQDMEYIKLQLSCETDFASAAVLKLLLSLSFLPQNLEAMRSAKFINSLSLIFEGGANLLEQEIAAQLVQAIVEFEASTDSELPDVEKKVCSKYIYMY